MTGAGLDEKKQKGCTNKRLLIDIWGFVLFNMGNAQEEEEQHARVFSFMQCREKKVKEQMAVLMIECLENAC